MAARDITDWKHSDLKKNVKYRCSVELPNVPTQYVDSKRFTRVRWYFDLRKYGDIYLDFDKEWIFKISGLSFILRGVFSRDVSGVSVKYTQLPGSPYEGKMDDEGEISFPLKGIHLTDLLDMMVTKINSTPSLGFYALLRSDGLGNYFLFICETEPNVLATFTVRFPYNFIEIQKGATWGLFQSFFPGSAAHVVRCYQFKVDNDSIGLLDVAFGLSGIEPYTDQVDLRPSLGDGNDRRMMTGLIKKEIYLKDFGKHQMCDTLSMLDSSFTVLTLNDGRLLEGFYLELTLDKVPEPGYVQDIRFKFEKVNLDFLVLVNDSFTRGPSDVLNYRAAKKRRNEQE